MANRWQQYLLRIDQFDLLVDNNGWTVSAWNFDAWLPHTWIVVIYSLVSLVTCVQSVRSSISFSLLFGRLCRKRQWYFNFMRRHTIKPHRNCGGGGGGALDTHSTTTHRASQFCFSFSTIRDLVYAMRAHVKWSNHINTKCNVYSLGSHVSFSV